MNLGIKNKKALITGAGRGIGKGIANSLAKEGVIIAAVSRGKESLLSTVDNLAKNDEEHIAIPMDLVPDESPKKLVEILKNNNFSPDIIIHNLGGDLFIKDPFCSIAEWRQIYRLNFEIIVDLNRMLVPNMQKNKWGRVIHVSSIASMENQGAITYCSIKAALTAYTRSFGGVVAPDGVVVSAILPGAVFTEKGYWDIMLEKQPEHVNNFLSERQRIGRFGTTAEIGDYTAFLCSQQASFNTGSIVPIDGGQGRGYFGQ